jgi:8-oxo-dGTP diphosphatase
VKATIDIPDDLYRKVKARVALDETRIRDVTIPAGAVIDVVCGLIEDGDGRFLACRRAPGQSQAGFWELPGGKIEEDESPEAALRRELDEELGIDVEVGAQLATVEHDYGTIAIRLVACRCRIAAGAPEAREHAEIRWAGPGELKTLAWAPADAKLFRMLQTFLQPLDSQ